MKRIVYVMVICLVILGVFANFANALDKTSTGFFYPTGESNPDQANGGWLYGAPGYPSYMDGNQSAYHVGVDMMTNSINADVYAISDGIVKPWSKDGWGSGNIGLVVEHKKKNGSVFTVVYGHLRSDTVPGEGKSVYAGKSIGKTGNWNDGIHLHFGIHDGPYNTMPRNGWGRVNIVSWSDKGKNGFTDPVDFIRNDSPYNWLASTPYRLVGNLAWYPADKPCTEAERWAYFSSGYPNGGASYANNAICYTYATSMKNFLDFSVWEAIIYGRGTNDLDKINICK